MMLQQQQEVGGDSGSSMSACLQSWYCSRMGPRDVQRRRHSSFAPGSRCMVQLLQLVTNRCTPALLALAQISTADAHTAGTCPHRHCPPTPTHLRGQHRVKPVVHVIEHRPRPIKHGVELQQRRHQGTIAQPPSTCQLQDSLQAYAQQVEPYAQPGCQQCCCWLQIEVDAFVLDA